MQMHPIRDLFWKAFRLDESRLPSSCIDTSCLKSVQKYEIIHHVPYRKHYYCSKQPLHNWLNLG